MRRLYLSIIFSVFSLTAAFSQTGANCTQTIRLIRSTYEQGRLHELPGLADGCLNPKGGKAGFTKEEQREAYRYLTLAYIYLEEPDSADINMLKLLETDHFYHPNETIDPAEFIALYNKFRRDPVFRIGLKVGVNTTQPTVLEYYNVGSTAGGTGKYGLAVGFNVMAVFEKDLAGKFKNFVVAPEVGFVSRTFNYTNPNLNFADKKPDSTVSTQQFVISQQWLDVNALVQYRLKAVNPVDFYTYVGAGPGFSLLLGSKNQPSTTYGSGSNGYTVTGPQIDDSKSYNNLVYSVILTAGFKKRIGELYLTGDIRYQIGLSNVVNNASRTNEIIGFDYAGTYNNYRMSNLMIQLGVLFPRFVPKKLVK
jgi:hypothetical protein